MSKKTIIFGILLILWMGVIFVMSISTGDSSGNTSKKIVAFVVDKYDKIVGSSEEKILYHKSDEFLDHANHVFRKICHFSEFMILSILALNFVLSIYKWNILCVLYSTVFSIIYACLDEWHQTFVSNRSGNFKDILIDSCGVITGTIIMSLIIIFISRKKVDKKH